MDEAAVPVEETAVDLARHVQDRRRRDKGLELATHGVRRSWTRRGEEHTETTGRPRVAVGRAGGTLLVADGDGANPPVAPDGVVDGEVVNARDAEHDVDTGPRESVHDRIAAVSLGHLAAFLRSRFFGGSPGGDTPPS